MGASFLITAMVVAYCDVPVSVAPNSVPADGAIVPPDPLLFLTDRYREAQLLDADGAIVATHALVVVLAGEGAVRLLPQQPLVPGARYSLAGKDMGGPLPMYVQTAAVSTFVVGEVDATNPAPPVLEPRVERAVDIEDCTGADRVVVTATVGDDVVLLHVRVNDGRVRESFELPGSDLVVFRPLGASAIHLDVVALDAAGNASDPVSVDVDVSDPPPPPAEEEHDGCAGGAGGGGLALAAVLRRSRRPARRDRTS